MKSRFESNDERLDRLHRENERYKPKKRPELYPDDYLYHVTYRSNLPSIKERGLMPFFKSSFPTVTRHKDSLYFTNGPGIEYWKDYFWSEPAVLRCHRSLFRHLLPDPDGSFIEQSWPDRRSYVARDMWIKEEGVIPEELEVLVDDKWVPIMEWS